MVRPRYVWKKIAFLFFAIAILGWILTPQYLGFSIIPLFLSFAALVIYGLKNFLYDIKNINLKIVKKNFLILILLVLLVASAFFTHLPIIDLTPEKQFSLSKYTLNILDKIESPVLISVYTSENRQKFLKPFLALYPAHNSKITIEYKDPNYQAASEVETLLLKQQDTATITSGDFIENITPINEKSISDSLLRLTEPEFKIVYFIYMLGEKLSADTSSTGLSKLKETLENKNIIVKDFYWGEDIPLPKEADLLIWASPKLPIEPEKETYIFDYIKNGGRLFLMLDPLISSFSQNFFQQFGLEYPKALVIDPDGSLARTSNSFILSNDFPRHPITEGLSQPVIWPIAGAILSAGPDFKTDFKSFAIAMSSEYSWLEFDLKSLSQQPTFNKQEDLSGPLPLAAASETKEGTGRLVITADSDFASNAFLTNSGNETWLLNAINWLLNNENYEKDTLQAQSLHINENKIRFLFWLPVFIWPLIVLTAWFIYYNKRKHKR